MNVGCIKQASNQTGWCSFGEAGDFDVSSEPDDEAFGRAMQGTAPRCSGDGVALAESGRATTSAPLCCVANRCPDFVH